jgi:hypothetical protein
VSLHFSLLSFTCIAADFTQSKKLNHHRNRAQCRTSLGQKTQKTKTTRGRETKIVNTESGNRSLFAAARNRDASLAVLSYTQRSHVAQPCFEERATRARCLSFHVYKADYTACHIQWRVNQGNSEVDTEAWRRSGGLEHHRRSGTRGAVVRVRMRLLFVGVI